MRIATTARATDIRETYVSQGRRQLMLDDRFPDDEVTVQRADAPSLSREDGVVSTILNTATDSRDTDLTVTWVTVEPGGTQKRHSHDPEQVYVVVAGEGQMTVGDEQRPVRAGTLVHIPSNTDHELENTGEETLQYVSAATPSFPSEEIEAFYEE